MKLLPCKREEATHVRISENNELDQINEYVTIGGIYEYLYDDDPCEECHYIIGDDKSYLYDFEVFITCEYLKLS